MNAVDDPLNEKQSVYDIASRLPRTDKRAASWKVRKKGLTALAHWSREVLHEPRASTITRPASGGADEGGYDVTVGGHANLMTADWLCMRYKE